jgi:hypothetical protein
MSGISTSMSTGFGARPRRPGFGVHMSSATTTPSGAPMAGPGMAPRRPTALDPAWTGGSGLGAGSYKLSDLISHRSYFGGGTPMSDIIQHKATPGVSNITDPRTGKKFSVAEAMGLGPLTIQGWNTAGMGRGRGGGGGGYSEQSPSTPLFQQDQQGGFYDNFYGGGGGGNGRPAGEISGARTASDYFRMRDQQPQQSRLGNRVSAFAHGTKGKPVPHGQPFIAGDSTNGKPNEELILPTPQGVEVLPLKNLPRMARGTYGYRPTSAEMQAYNEARDTRAPMSLAGRSGGLNSFYQDQNDLYLENAAENSIDPVSGLSQAPTQRAMSEQIRMLAEKPTEFPGYGGLEQAMLMSDYYDAKRSGNPARLAAAAHAITTYKDRLGALREQQAGVAGPGAIPPGPPSTSSFKAPASDWAGASAGGTMGSNSFGGDVAQAVNPAAPPASAPPPPPVPYTRSIPTKYGTASATYNTPRETFPVFNNTGEYDPDFMKKLMVSAAMPDTEGPEHYASGYNSSEGTNFTAVDDGVTSPYPSKESVARDEMRKSLRPKTTTDVADTYNNAIASISNSIYGTGEPPPGPGVTPPGYQHPLEYALKYGGERNKLANLEKLFGNALGKPMQDTAPRRPFIPADPAKPTRLQNLFIKGAKTAQDFDAAAGDYLPTFREGRVEIPKMSKWLRDWLELQQLRAGLYLNSPDQ